MLKTIALTIAIAALSGGAALGQTVRAPLPDQPTAAWLVKHDKEDNGHGRKLGHFKQHLGVRAAYPSLQISGDSALKWRLGSSNPGGRSGPLPTFEELPP